MNLSNKANRQPNITRSDSENSNNGQVKFLENINNSNNMYVELSELNSSTNSILFTSPNSLVNISNIKSIKKINDGPIKLNDSFLKLKKSSSADLKTNITQMPARCHNNDFSVPSQNSPSNIILKFCI